MSGRKRKTTNPEDFTTRKMKGEARIAVRQADIKRLVFLLGFCRKAVKKQKTVNLRFWLTNIMAFFQSSITVLQTLVIAIGAGLGLWGGINLMEGYGNDNPGAKSQGIKQLMAGGGIALIGGVLVPVLGTLFG